MNTDAKNKTFRAKGIIVTVCTDIRWWAKQFYAMPKGAVIANEEAVSRSCMGFAEIERKNIWIFLPQRYSLSDLKKVVAHEVGHIIELKHVANPEQIEMYDSLHEEKADHYMNYYILVDKIIDRIRTIKPNTKP